MTYPSAASGREDEDDEFRGGFGDEDEDEVVLEDERVVVQWGWNVAAIA